jgi:hypothetical protein
MVSATTVMVTLSFEIQTAGTAAPPAERST